MSKPPGDDIQRVEQTMKLRLAIPAFVVLCFWTSLGRADQGLWRCGYGMFVTDPSKAEFGPCERFVGAQVCGSGANKFFTPTRSGSFGTAGACRPRGEARSPFVRESELERAKSGVKLQERKLVSATGTSTLRGRKDDGEDPFATLQNLLGQVSSASPGSLNRLLDGL